MPILTRKFGLLAAGATIALTTTACSSGGISDGDQAVKFADGGTFTMGIPGDLGAFDPQKNVLSLPQYPIAYDTLIALKTNGDIVSGLATKWSETSSSVDFTLKPGITCSDGTPLTAGLVKENLEFMKDPKNASPFYGSWVPAIPFTVDVDDAAGTVKIKTSAPSGFLLRGVGTVPIVCAKGLKDRSILKTTSAGTGPFILTEYVSGDHYTFKVRKDYSWGPDGARTDAPGTPDKVVFKIVPSPTTAANLLLSGGLNAAVVEGPDSKRLLTSKLAHDDINAMGAELWFNQQNNRPAAELDVRKALVSALDLDEITKVMSPENPKRAKQIVALSPRPCTFDAVAGQLPSFDKSAAERHLDAAGWVKGSDGIRVKSGSPLKIELHYLSAVPGFAPTAELIAQKWKAIGVEVKLTAENLSAMGTTMFQTGNFDIYLDGFGFNLPTQVPPYVSGPVPPAGQNFTGIKNTEFEKFTQEATGKTGDAACKSWKSADQALIGNLDVVPISLIVRPVFVNKAQAKSNGFVTPIPTSIKLLR